MVDFYLNRDKITSKSGFTGMLSLYRERGSNGLYAVEFEVESEKKLPEKYLATVKTVYTLHVDHKRLKRRCCSISDDRVYLETDVKGYSELYEKIRTILSQ